MRMRHRRHEDRGDRREVIDRPLAREQLLRRHHLSAAKCCQTVQCTVRPGSDAIRSSVLYSGVIRCRFWGIPSLYVAGRRHDVACVDGGVGLCLCGH